MDAPAEPSTVDRHEAIATAHALSVDETLAALETSTEGIDDAAARLRLARFGPNELAATEPISALEIFVAQFRNLLIIILLVGAVLSAVAGHGLEAVIIAVIVVMAAVLGFVQESRAERAMQALRQLASPTAEVIRSGHRRTVPARDLVPGDIVVLEAGDRVPADVRLLEASNLLIDESALTGESTAADKTVEPVPADAPLGDRSCMAYAGTVVLQGRGRGVVVATGMHTEFGKIAGLLQTVETGRTPLQHNLDRVGRVLAVVALVVVAVIVVAGLIRGQGILDMFVFGIALAVAVVPEALPAVVTVSLAIGVRRMVRRNALVRRLPAVETLGSVSVICTDKTGTLTKNEMTVTEIVTPSTEVTLTGSGFDPAGNLLVGGAAVESPPRVVAELLAAGALASDAAIEREDEGRWTVHGDPTEAALIVAARKAGIDLDALTASMPRVGEIPFSSERKRMTTLHESPDGGVIAFSKGAPEVILASCLRVEGEGSDEALDDATRRALLDRAAAMAERGLRVLGFAVKRNADAANAEEAMTFLGFAGLLDPPRPEVPAAIEACRHAGIRVVMITGDHPATAAAVARELGILGEGAELVAAQELAAMTDDDLDRRVMDIAVYARVSPADKLRIVSAWQRRGHIAAMTGDGVNDAPSLKKADVGVAMGITGTDVSKEAAEIVLLDDNFASIVAAVEEGRGIFANIKKYLMYLLSSNLGEIGLMAAATFAGLPLPLSAVQILYVNLATDGLPALALSVDPPEADLMERPPRDPRHGIFTKPVVALMAVGGLWSTIVNLTVFVASRAAGGTVREAMAHTFASLVIIQFLKAYAYRSDHRSTFEAMFANRWLNLAIVWELALFALILYVPFLQKAFGTNGFDSAEWLFVVAASLTVLPVLELAKALVRRGWFGPVD